LFSLEFVPPYEKPDRDGDRIVDALDACPDVPGVKSDDPKKNGCPPDADGDGILDVEDACRDVPGVRDPDPKKNGCPPDTDGDGILDDVDACPKLPGPKNVDPKKNGCPLVIVTEKEIRINEQVKFKFNSAEILPESGGILGEVKKVFDEHPEIKKVRVEGHTDNVGKPAYNKALSQRRAASVMKWLTDHGIDKKRLISEGFGQSEPIDTNDTDAGRANNRRVAFTILERDEKAKGSSATPTPTPAPTPAPAPTGAPR
jgi:outer membrane protein OmpA-like peptidoglycan-associated protein